MTLAQRRKFTYDDYCKLPDEPRMELIDGDYLMTPAPGFSHQNISLRLAHYLFQHIEKRKLGTVLAAPMDVILSDHDIVQPDILFISSAREHIIHDKIHGAPDLVVEIVSRGTKLRDREIKRRLYERHGVQEYWIVDPDSKTISVMRLRGGKFKHPKTYEKNQVIESAVIPRFKLAIRLIFSK